MYILFINLGGRCDIFFSGPTHEFNSTHVMGWVGFDLCEELGWVEFFLTHHGELGQKIPST